MGRCGSGYGQLVYPQGVALDSSNNVYVADAEIHGVEKFDSSGNYLTQWGGEGSGDGQFSSPGYLGPVGLAVDSSNNVYVADLSNDRIEEFDSNGNYLTQWGGYGSGNGQFILPAGVAVDSSNNIYVTDSRNYRVQKFDANGNYLIQWGGYGNGYGEFSSLTGCAVDSSNNVYVTDTDDYRVEKFDCNGDYLTQWVSDPRLSASPWTTLGTMFIWRMVSRSTFSLIIPMSFRHSLRSSRRTKLFRLASM